MVRPPNPPKNEDIKRNGSGASCSVFRTKLSRTTKKLRPKNEDIKRNGSGASCSVFRTKLSRTTKKLKQTMGSACSFPSSQKVESQIAKPQNHLIDSKRIVRQELASSVAPAFSGNLLPQFPKLGGNISKSVGESDTLPRFWKRISFQSHTDEE